MTFESNDNPIAISISVILSLIGVFGNGLVITVVLRRFKFESATYLLICHLALCDLFTCIFVAPLYPIANKTRSFPVCQAAIFIFCLQLLSSSWTLMLIACERYVYIKYPLRHGLIFTIKRIILTVSSLWAFSIALVAAMITVDLRETKEEVCLGKFANKWILYIYYPFLTVLPIILMLFAYSYILRIALRQQRKIEDFGTVEDKRTKAMKLRKERRTIVTLFILVISYAVCTLPYAIISVLDVIDINIIGKRGAIDNIALLWFTNAIINPGLYALTNKELRNEIRRVVSLRRNNTVTGSDGV